MRAHDEIGNFSAQDCSPRLFGVFKNKHNQHPKDLEVVPHPKIIIHITNGIMNIDIHIDINMNIDIHITINIHIEDYKKVLSSIY